MKKYCLIGWPLKHSLSPEIHNTAFEKLKINAKYDKFEINPEVFSREVKSLKENYSGFNVTIPYKTRIISFLDDIDTKAKNVGAVNTVCLIDGTWKGYNTDIDGFISPLLVLNREFKNCLLMGSGGAARAVISALIDYISPRYIWMGVVEFDQAEKLKNDFENYAMQKGTQINIYPAKEIGDKISKADLIINATPLGTTPDIEKTPLPGITNISDNTVVYDLVYNPSTTRLMNDAKKSANNIIAINGLEMLVGQAAAAFKLWTGQDMPKKEILEHLKNIL